ncbi:hypothetical protein LWI29_037615 [Acer saccharum]|uniref:Pentatricopeptide repeat-containing protein n=1 Tax=Acer saccharum TaxID=4024 RepID=A0AA39TG50_ACESA|nr:hypothetical protein LWI29_037615 [Acer saccharum]
MSTLANETISKLKRCKSMKEFHQIHTHMIKTNLVNHTLTISKLIALYSLSALPNSLSYASSVFRRIENPNYFIFYTLTKGFCDYGDPLDSITYYVNMVSCLNELDKTAFSLPFVLKACSKLRAFKERKQFFGQILKTQLWFDPFVSNFMVRMFLELGEIEFARRVFDKMPERDLISWNSMITGYLRVGEVELASQLFKEMPERDFVSVNTMIDGYGKCGRCELAEEVFRMMNEKDVVSWTSMISAYVINQHSSKALDLFREMLSLGVKPDVPAIVSVLADLGFVEEGKWVHDYISSNKINLNSGFTASALIDMYSKCGYIENAYDVFRRVSHGQKKWGLEFNDIRPCDPWTWSRSPRSLP